MRENPSSHIDLAVIWDGMLKETAQDLLTALFGDDDEIDRRIWSSLIRSFPNPAVALVDLAIKAGSRFPETSQRPSQPELAFFLTGMFKPGKKAVETALYIANHPQLLAAFQKATSFTPTQTCRQIAEVTVREIEGTM